VILDRIWGTDLQDGGRFGIMFSFAKEYAPKTPKIRLKLLKYAAVDWITEQDLMSGYKDPDADGEGETETDPMADPGPVLKTATPAEKATSAEQSIGVLIVLIVSGMILVVVTVGGVALIVCRKKLPHAIAPEGIPMDIRSCTPSPFKNLDTPSTKVKNTKFGVIKLFFR
jgi:hypothetical protein